MATAIKFKPIIDKPLKVVPRCVFCGKVIPAMMFVCKNCDTGRFNKLKKALRDN